MVQDCHEELCRIRNDSEELEAFSGRIYDHSWRVARGSDIQPTMPRVCQRQQHRANLQCDDIRQYLRVTILVPFLDHLIVDIGSRFDKHLQKVAPLQGLLPVSGA